MATVSEQSSGIVRITTSGISNLAALIPLITTELCEKHVTKTLKKGLLYAAASPMTIFGSLGIAKAGLIALCATIDYGWFHGPALLKNAGFPPRGMGKLFLHVKHNKHHLYKAEDKLRTILSKKKVTEVQVNLRSWDFWWWNLRLIMFTAAGCVLGFLPYILLISIYLKAYPFHMTWIFPFFLLLGSGVVAVNTQLLFQIRLIEETYCRLRFIAADAYLKDEGKCIPSNWDPNERSKKVFAQLESEWKDEAPQDPVESIQLSETDSRPSDSEKAWELAHRLDKDDKKRILDGVHTLTSFNFPRNEPTGVPTATQAEDNGTLHRRSTSKTKRSRATPSPLASGTLLPSEPNSAGLSVQTPGTPNPSIQDTLYPPPGSAGRTPSHRSPNHSPRPSSHQRADSRQGTVEFNKAEMGASDPAISDARAPRRADTGSSAGSKSLPEKAGVLINWLTLQFPTLILWGTQTILFMGVLFIIVGYIGCFSLMQLPGVGWKGALVWFFLELLLSGARTLIWAMNPKWDDAKLPIVLEKVRLKDGKRAPENSSSYGIGWTLDSPTADDMHALIIGLNNCNTNDFLVLDKARSDAQSVAAYLEGTLLVPPSQIRTLYDKEATRSKIVEELKSLRHRGSVTPDAPIVIYYAGHSFVADDGNTYLVPYLPEGDKNLEGQPERYCLPYSEIVDLLRHVADEKTDNIVVILDSCHAGAMGHGQHDQPTPRPPGSSTLTHSSKLKHIDLPLVSDPEEIQRLSSDSSLLPSLSRISADGDPGGMASLTNLPLSPKQDAEALAEVDSKLRESGQAQETNNRGKAAPPKRQKKITRATTEILVGHSSHLLLAGADSSQQAYEDPAKGGQFTQKLLEVLREAGKPGGNLNEMTYKTLVDGIQDKFREIVVDHKDKRTLLNYQTALCTTIYQDRYLFDGLFTRKVDNTSAKPVMKVLYSD